MVDAVYTWVDGERPRFAEELAAATAAHGRETGQTPAARAVSPNRFRDNDCLRYSLRSVRQHAPWVERIHIVTAGERPAWLDPDHPSIRMVRHDEIFPVDGALPTFNSHAIEACLHLIDGVSDQFLYFNDDCFLTADLDLGYFARPDGSPRFSLQTWQMFSDLHHPSPVAASAAHCRRLLDGRFGRRPVRRETPHEPALLERAVLAAMEREWPQELDRTRRNRLRTGRDFVVTRMYVHYRLELALSVASRGNEPVDIRPTRAGFVRFGVGTLDLAEQLREATGPDRPFLCVNDETGEDEPIAPERLRADLEVLQAFFRRRFPDPAPWEIDVSCSRAAG